VLLHEVTAAPSEVTTVGLTVRLEVERAPTKFIAIIEIDKYKHVILSLSRMLNRLFTNSNLMQRILRAP
jgi:hypothetical protein